MARAALVNGLYAITDTQLIPTGQLTNCVTRAIAGGASVIQYRNKQAADNVRQH